MNSFFLMYYPGFPNRFFPLKKLHDWQSWPLMHACLFHLMFVCLGEGWSSHSCLCIFLTIRYIPSHGRVSFVGSPLSRRSHSDVSMMGQLEDQIDKKVVCLSFQMMLLLGSLPD